MIHVQFQRREGAPPLRVIHRTAASPPLSDAQVAALADMADAPLRPCPGQWARTGQPFLHPGFRGRQRHTRVTVASLLLRGFASADEDRLGTFVEITEAGRALVQEPGAARQASRP